MSLVIHAGRDVFGGVYADDPLWDWMNCPTNNCCDFNTPPWFNVQLLNSPMDDIEVCICANESTMNGNILVQLLEIYIKDEVVLSR